MFVRASLIAISALALGLLVPTGPLVGAGMEDAIVFEKWMPDEARKYWGDTVELWTVRSDGSALRRLTSGFYDTGASWAPDRKRIAFSRHGELQVLRLEDSSISSLPSEHKTLDPQWLDGNTLLACSSVGPEKEFNRRWRLLTVNVETGSTEIVDTGSLIGVFGPRLSPDRSRVAFTAWQSGKQKLFVAEIDDPAGTARVILDQKAFPQGWDSDGGSVLVVTDDDSRRPICRSVTLEGAVGKYPVEARECNVTWSPSGGMLVYQEIGALWVMDADGAKRRPLVEAVDDGRFKNPEWR